MRVDCNFKYFCRIWVIVPVFPKHLKSRGFTKGCWYPPQRENTDNYTEFEDAASNIGLNFLFSKHFWGVKNPHLGFFGNIKYFKAWVF